jgi:hypothetical protein
MFGGRERNAKVVVSLARGLRESERRERGL